MGRRFATFGARVFGSAWLRVERVGGEVVGRDDLGRRRREGVCKRKSIGRPERRGGRSCSSAQGTQRVGREGWRGWRWSGGGVGG